MLTLKDKFPEWDDYDISDKTFERPLGVDSWQLNVPASIQKNWRLLQDDEKFLIALTADYNIKH